MSNVEPGACLDCDCTAGPSQHISRLPDSHFVPDKSHLAMATVTGRRSRTLESDDEDPKPNTPRSTAPNDSKRQRRTIQENDSSSDEPSRPPTSSTSVFHRLQTTATARNNIGTHVGHQPGAIVRVKLTNFVTYTSAEFFPGPNLNMVIGPNGTGKSTLVCAICLGLGWPPSVSLTSRHNTAIR